MDRADLELVLAIRDQGSLSAAADALGLAAPAVTKRLASLESRLGMRLFQRTTRRVSATGEGDAICFRYEDDPAPDCWIVTGSASGLLARYLTNPPEIDPVVVEDASGPLSCPGPEVGV